MNRRIPVSVALTITILAMTVTFAITWIVSMSTFDDTVSSVTALQAQYSKLSEIDNYVRANFIGEIDDDYLFDRVASGYMNGLNDRYSTYYTEKEYTELSEIEDGTLVGIGIEAVRDADGSFRIARVYDNSPAARAGVRKNGVILRLNGESISNINSVSALRSLLRGAQGTELAMDCLYGVAEEESFTVRRTNYTAPTVDSRMLGDYAYIRIISFGTNVFTDFDYAVRNAVEDGAKGFVFDVRGVSSGAYRQPLMDMIDILCPRGTIARRENRNGTTTVLGTSDENEVGLPMVVLVNEGTAGAGELFAVSIRDLAGGQVVGMRTLGRGTVQSTPQRLSDGSAVAVTIGRILTGSGESYNLVGVNPDITIEPLDISETMILDPDPAMDNQIKRALEVARSMVLAAGGDAGTANTDTSQSAASQAPASGADGSGSLDASDLSGVDGDTSDISGDASGTDDSDAGDDADKSNTDDSE